MQHLEALEINRERSDYSKDPLGGSFPFNIWEHPNKVCPYAHKPIPESIKSLYSYCKGST